MHFVQRLKHKKLHRSLFCIPLLPLSPSISLLLPSLPLFALLQQSLSLVYNSRLNCKVGYISFSSNLAFFPLRSSTGSAPRCRWTMAVRRSLSADAESRWHHRPHCQLPRRLLHHRQPMLRRRPRPRPHRPPH